MSRRALWQPSAPVAAGNGSDDKGAGPISTRPMNAPGAAARPLPTGSEIDVAVKLERFADLLIEAGGIVREVSRLQLDEARKTRLMSSVETPKPTRLLTVDDLAEKLQVDARTIRRWRKAGKIPAGIEIGDAVIRWREDEIERWLA